MNKLADELRNSAVEMRRVLEWLQGKQVLTEPDHSRISDVVETAKVVIDRFDTFESEI